MIIGVKNCEEYKENYAVEVEYIDLFSTKIYPDGKGGQLGDRGEINGIKIVEVKKDKIIIEKPLEDGEYEYTIDMERRKDIAVQHSIEHVFSGIMYKDYNIHNVGFRMSEESSTIDFDYYDFTKEMIEEIEKKINDAILKGAPILTRTVLREEIDTVTGLRKKISPKITDEYIRLIKIEGYDLCACSGFHVENIKDVRLFKILSSKRIKGKYTRFTFIAGERAIKDYNNKAEIIKTLNQKFSCRDYELIDRIEKDRKKYVELRREYNRLCSELQK